MLVHAPEPGRFPRTAAASTATAATTATAALPPEASLAVRGDVQGSAAAVAGLGLRVEG